MVGRRWLLFLLWLLVFSVPIPRLSWGQYEVEPQSPVWIRGILDLRVAQGRSAPAWTDRGWGKSRYGGRVTSLGWESATRLAVSHFAVEIGATLPWEIEARAQLNWETDIDSGDRPLLIEALLRREWGTWEHGWGVQTGVLNAPLSLEHTGPAVTPLYTLTPSALSTWIWEEGRVVGGAVDWWRVLPNRMRLSLLLGSGFGADQKGHVLAVRGWVMSDALVGINSDLPLPMRRGSVAAFDERDNRPSLYSLATLTNERETFSFHLGYFDTLGDQRVQGVWETRFGTAGMIWRPIGRLEVLAQYLEGVTMVRGSACDVGFSGWYALASWGYRRHRVSVRYDAFRTKDSDGAPSYRERGDGGTFAYLFELGLHHRLGVEYLFLQSHHHGAFIGDPSDGGWQLSYRFRY